MNRTATAGSILSWFLQGFRKSDNLAMKPVLTKGYLVLGMHRSGTSCLAGLLETAGPKLGNVSRQNKHNKKGNLENGQVQAVNHAILQQFGGSWHSPPNHIQWQKIDPRPLQLALDSFRQHPMWVLKDPRMLLTLEAWLPLIAHCQMIGTFRHPVAVARSLDQRDEMSIEQGLSLWTAYNRRLVFHHRKHQFPLLNFDLQGDEYLQQFRCLCQMVGLNFDSDAAAQFYEPELVSQDPDASIELSSETTTLQQYLLGHQIQVASHVFGQLRSAC